MCFRKCWHPEICHTKNVIASYTKTQCTDAAKCYTRTVTLSLYISKRSIKLTSRVTYISLTIIGLRSRRTRRSLDTTLVLYAKLYSVAVGSKTWRASRLRQTNTALTAAPLSTCIAIWVMQITGAARQDTS